MMANVFGGISSPSSSNYTLKKTAANNVNKNRNEVSTIAKRNFYVDQMLKSFPDVETAGDSEKGGSTLLGRWIPFKKIHKQ